MPWGLGSAMQSISPLSRQTPASRLLIFPQSLGWVARSRGRITSSRKFGRMLVITYHPDILGEVSWGTLAHNSRPAKQNQRISGQLFCWQFARFSRLQLPRDTLSLSQDEHAFLSSRLDPGQTGACQRRSRRLEASRAWRYCALQTANMASRGVILLTPPPVRRLPSAAACGPHPARR